MEADCAAWCLFTAWLTSSKVGSVASVLGVLLSVMGFAITIRNVYVSRQAAERAEVASLETREALRLFDTIQELTSAVSALEEVKRLHRERAWNTLPERYSALRKSLITIRRSNPALSEDQQSRLQSAITFLADMEKRVERSLDDGQPIEKIARFNELASDHVVGLHELLLEIRQQSGAM